jgi:hypothetical protein
MIEKKKPTERKTCIKSFVERNRAPISVLGVLIVFATFLIKDRFEEKWKDEAATIELARDFYETRADSASVLSSIDGMREFLLPQVFSHTDQVGGDSEGLIRPFRQVQTSLRSEGSALTSTERSLDRIESLMKRFTHEKKDEDMLNELKAKDEQFLNTNRSDLAAVATTIGLLKQNNNPPAQRPDQPPNVFSQQLALSLGQSKAAMDRANLPGDRVGLINAANRLFQKVLAEAESSEKNNETLATWAWWVSIVLYAIGAVGAVVGVIYGVHMPEA